MSLLDVAQSSSSPVSDTRQLVDRYLRLRPVRMAMNHKLVRRLSRDDLREGAKKLGLLKGQQFVFNTEDETSVLMDYCIYEVYRHGQNAIDRYLRDCPPPTGSDEMLVLSAMQQSSFELLQVQEVERGVGCRCRNLATDEVRLLIDMGLSTSTIPGTLLVTRINDFGEFIATTGAALPLGIPAKDILAKWERDFKAARGGAKFDSAAIIRAYLKSGMSSQVTYTEPGSTAARTGQEQYRIDGPTETKRASTAPGASKPDNRRCRCRSGKMYKNCCGKTARQS
jgi:hypothetical protein